MSSVEIYMEGGGEHRDGRERLRLGMDTFLDEIKDMARSRSTRWKLVPCGGRSQAFRRFVEACRSDRNGIFVLLIDSEGPVNTLPRAHLVARDQRNLDGVDEDRIHLMVQVMETWIVADPEALAVYYGQGFRANVLPSRRDLEEESKTSIAHALDRATERTRKGRYHKIRHAADLLARIDPAKARARCRHCARLFATLDAAVAAG